MLSTVQISDAARVLRRYPHELSGGQQQRVMFAMALATDPDLLVLDEPTTGLDATVEAEVLDLVEDLRREFNTSILFVSHNLGIVARMCERVGVLYAGRMIEQGNARELFRDPRHPYTLALLRCVPRLGMRKDTDRLDPIPGSLPPLGLDVPGCVFADRCPIARDRCVQEPPSLCAGERRPHRPLLLPGGGARHPAGRRRRPRRRSRRYPTRCSLKVSDLVKTYRFSGTEVFAVGGVDVEVKRGEVFGLVGESGSGKTSFAKCIVGLIDVTSGELSFNGMDVSKPAGKRPGEARRRLQMVFQNPDNALNPTHSVRAILRRSLLLLAGVRGRDAQDQQMAELARSVRLEPRHLDVRPAALSGGLKQRVAIARSFAGSPAMVLCDEPTSALDVSVQAAILNLLVDLAAAPGRLLRLHLPRPRGRALRRRLDRRHVPGQARRRRRGGPGLRRPRTTRTPRRCSRPSRRSTSRRAGPGSSSPARCRAPARCRRAAPSTPAARGCWARSAGPRRRPGRRTASATATAATSPRPSSRSCRRPLLIRPATP